GIDKRITFGIILIFIGGLFLLNTLDIIDFRVSRIIFSFPFILFIVGLLIMINSGKKMLGGIFMGIGLIWLLPRIFPHLDYGPGLIIPVLLILLGLIIIFKIFKKKGEAGGGYIKEELKQKRMKEFEILGGGTKVIY